MAFDDDPDMTPEQAAEQLMAIDREVNERVSGDELEIRLQTVKLIVETQNYLDELP